MSDEKEKFVRLLNEVFRAPSTLDVAVRNVFLEQQVQRLNEQNAQLMQVVQQVNEQLMDIRLNIGEGAVRQMVDARAEQHLKHFENLLSATQALKVKVEGALHE